MMTEQTLNRSDGRIVAFMGEQIADGSTKQRDGDRKTRWYTARVLRTQSGYRVGIAHKTCWEGERDEFWILDFENNSDVKKDIVVAIHAHVKDEVQAEELSSTIETQLNRTSIKKRVAKPRTPEIKTPL